MGEKNSEIVVNLSRCDENYGLRTEPSCAARGGRSKRGLVERSRLCGNGGYQDEGLGEREIVGDGEVDLRHVFFRQKAL